jgi:PPOX class probable F420-dependent enzyme
MPVLPPDVEEFLKGPHVAALATMRPEGRPHVVPVWYEWDGREFTMASFRELQKVKNIANKGSAALSIFTSELPYFQVTVEGPAHIGGAIDNVWRERVAVRYLGEAAGKAYARDTMDLDSVAIMLRPLRWHTEGFGSSKEGEDDAAS